MSIGTDIHINHNKDNGLIHAAKKIQKYNGNGMQFFITPEIKKMEQHKLSDFKKYVEDNKMFVVIHSMYTHNIAQNWDEYSWTMKSMEIEMSYADKLGANFFIVHFGKSMDLDIEIAYNNMYTFLLTFHNKTKHIPTKILLETTAGQGTEMCHRLEDLAYFYKKISKSVNKEFRKRIKLCIDTCHLFAAGYDLRGEKKIKLFLETFNELIGLQHIKLVHFNDSKLDLGSRKDRHENIGTGYIGLESLNILHDIFANMNIPMILETPNNGYKTEIRLLKKI